MKIALISDIHGNYLALRAVIKHIDAQGDVEKIYCLGDIVGYGPQPEECIDLVWKRCELTLIGNHDFALINAAIGFNPIAAGAISCIRKRMEPGMFSLSQKKQRWEWLKNLPERFDLGEDLLVHASPRDNIFEYILPDDPLYAPDKIDTIMAMCNRFVFVGHTHRPGVITADPRFYAPHEVDYEFDFAGHEKLIFNVSSVGQPRDRDSRACYAIVSESGVRWHRVEYDVEETIRLVLETDCLDERCGTRLREGR